MLLTQKRKFVWIYTTLRSTDFLYGNGVGFYQFKAKRLWKKTILCFRNIAKYFTVGNMNKMK